MVRGQSSLALAQRYAAWLDRHRNLIFALSAVILVAGGFLASKLPLRSDLSSLLPPSKRSVQDLEVLRHRARTFGNALVMLDAPDAATRATAAVDLEAKLRALDPALVSSISTDDNAAARFGWAHRFLFVDLADLKEAKAALDDRLRRARLEANPLYVDLDDDEEQAAAEAAASKPGKLDELEARLADAEKQAQAPVSRISTDGKSQLYSLAVTFPSSDITKDRIVMDQLHAIAADLEARYPGTVIKFAGSINISIFEHDSVISGMAIAAIVTVVLVFLGLWFYYRSLLAVLGSLWALFVGVSFTLGFTWVAIGHLNLLSAFLTAIVVGNGINPGLIILARYFEEMREHGTAPRDAIAPALLGSLHGTLAASLTASVAYGALIVTDFRGFRHFGIIGGVGMVACWLTAYVVLPVTLDWLDRRGWIKPTKAPVIGALVAHLAPKRIGYVLAGGFALTAVGLAVTTHYLVDDPFAKDWRDLQADGADIRAQHEVDAEMNARFAKDKSLSGHSYQLALAVDDRAQVAPLVAQLRAIEARRPKGQDLFVAINSIDDLVPPDQEAKLALLAEIRTTLDGDDIAQLADDEKARLLRLRPPDDLKLLTEADVPPDLLRPFVEQDGTVGRLIYVKGSPRFQTWNVDDRVTFAAAVRALPIPKGAIIGGEPLVIADIVDSMEHDAPLMIAVALLGSFLVVWLVVGMRRHGAITLVCGMSGVVVMIAACAVAGLRVHFLDLIALPITIGIGIDYAVNLVARDREDPRGPRHLLATTGGAVLLCSYTTVVGYGSLILSSNGGVRAFGLAAILGEGACIAMALVLAPALLQRFAPAKAAAAATPAAAA